MSNSLDGCDRRYVCANCGAHSGWPRFCAVCGSHELALLSQPNALVSSITGVAAAAASNNGSLISARSSHDAPLAAAQ